MRDISFATVDYCKWWSEGFPHKCRKRTAIYRVGGADWEPSRPLCKHDCGFCVGTRHVEAIGSSDEPVIERHVRGKDATYPIPPLLCREIARWATQKVAESQ
jgi:hypothetical protein